MSRSKNTKCVATHVDEETYYKFRFSAERNGQNVSDRIRMLIEDDNENEDMAAMLGVRKVEEIEKVKMKEAKATPRQMEYIELLCDMLGESYPSKEKMTVSEASDFIKALKEKVARRSDNE